MQRVTQSIAGIRTKIVDVAIEYEYLHHTPDEIINAHPHLKLEQIHDALSYYYENRAVLDKKSNEIYTNLNTVTTAIDKGTLITVVWGTKTLAKVAAANKTYKQKIFPLLMAQLKKCIPRDVPMHAESILPAIDEENKQEFLNILATRKPEMTPAQLARLKKTTKNL
jgi:uncharacterized protein (DUF433 family)